MRPPTYLIWPCRLRDWERPGSWEDTFHTVTVELASTESIPVVEVWLVACTTWESTWTNSKYSTQTSRRRTSLVRVSAIFCAPWTEELLRYWDADWLTFVLADSHPGYFGKKGMRHFRLQRNQQFTPTVNIDKLWSIVSEQTRLKAQTSKDKAAVIDVTKAVITFIF